MDKAPRWRLLWLLAAVLLAGTAAAALLFVLALDSGYFKPAFVRYVSHRAGRDIRIDGALHLQLLSLHPQMSAESVVIGNPPWTPAGVTAEIGKLTVVYGTPFSRTAGPQELLMEAVRLHLRCDADGRANWQRIDPARGPGGALPLLRRLQMRDAQADLDDVRRHLQFTGRLSAMGGAAPADALHIAGRGQLNGREVVFKLDGDPLSTVEPGKPYPFKFEEGSSGSRVVLHGTLPKPFDLDLLDAGFEADGADFNDLRYLVGLNFVNTGAYRLSGKLARRGTRIAFTDLSVRSGGSDVRGAVSSDVQKDGRTRINADLDSNLLRLADLGLAAAGRGAPPPSQMFSDTPLNTEVARRVDFTVRYRAARLQLRTFELQSLAGDLQIEHGILTAPALSGTVLRGTWRAAIRLDVNQAPPAAHLDLDFADVQLGMLPHKGDAAPLEGGLHGRIVVSGRGRSVHQVAATAEGNMRAQMAHGSIRDSLAELAGIDLRGVGLILTRSKREAAVPCVVANFTAHSGTLTTQTLIVDTEPVRIEGNGSINLDSEALNLTLRGHPKRTRLFRLAAPLHVDGTLSKPHVQIEPHDGKLKLLERGTGEGGGCADDSAG